MSFFRMSTGLLLLGLAACGSQSDPGSDSTTHFWQTCVDDAECGTLEQCFCGRCTRECRNNNDCAGNDVECVATGAALACEQELSVCAPRLEVQRSAASTDVDASVSHIEEAETATETAPVNGTAESGTGADVTGAESGTGADVEAVATAASVSTEAAATELGAETSSLDAPSTALVDPADQGATSGATAPIQGDYIPLGVEWWRWASDKPEAASDCTLVLGEASPTSCTFSWQCAERVYDVECQAGEDGSAYSCYCNNPTFGESGYFAYLVPTDSPTSACPAAFEACTTPPQPGECKASILPPEETEVYRCQWVSECTTTTPSGLEVAHLSPRRGQCTDRDGVIYCGCEGLNLARGYLVSEAEGVEACELAAAACDADELPTEWIYGDCANYMVVDAAEQCFVGRSCPIAGELSSSVSTLARLDASAQCFVTDAGDLECTCSNAHGTLTWVQSGSMGTAVCNDALELCERAQEIEFSAPACAPLMREETPTTCSKTRVCTSSGDLDGEVLLYTNYLWTSCNSAFDGWRCTCQAGEKHSLTLLDASLTPEQACDQYMNTCELELTFTPDLIPLP